jgi:hypothetical protein
MFMLAKAQHRFVFNSLRTWIYQPALLRTNVLPILGQHFANLSRQPAHTIPTMAETSQLKYIDVGLQSRP